MNVQSGSARISTLFFAALFFCGLGAFCFINLGNWLIISNSPEDHVNILFTFAGENTRITYSKYLFRKNPNVLWIISYPSAKIKSVLNRDNLDTSRITVVDTCTDTRSEVACCIEWQRSHSKELKAAMVSGRTPVIGLVSSWYHMRRIKLLFESQSRNDAYAIRFFPVQQNDLMCYKPGNTWWKNPATRNIVLSEWGKILYLYCRSIFKQS